MDGNNRTISMREEGKRPRDSGKEGEMESPQTSSKRGKASHATTLDKPYLGPRSMVTGDPYVFGVNDSVILDKFWSLKKANDVKAVVPANYIVTAKDVEGIIPESGLFKNSESMSKSTTGAVPALNTKAYHVEVEPKAIDLDQVLREEAVLRIMKKILPTESRVSKECIKHMQQCAAEFIGMISSEAGMVTLCESAPQRVAKDCTGSRIVKGSDVIEALSGLGYTNYAKVTSSHLTKFQVQKKPPDLVYKPPPSATAWSSSSASQRPGQSKTYKELMTAEADLTHTNGSGVERQRSPKNGSKDCLKPLGPQYDRQCNQFVIV